jgi:putative sugar O-methyltransferase
VTTSTTQIRRVIQHALRKIGYNIYRLSEEERRAYARYDDQLRKQDLTSIFGADLPRLQALRRRYDAVQLPVAIHSVWGARNTAEAQRDIGWGYVDLRSFRGHSAYVWDYAGSNLESTNLKYYLYTEAIRRKDAAGLLDKLSEDGAFGCVTFEYPGLPRVSRDLLDSVVEINFLDKHLQLLSRDDLSILDIGAGYGRMAHRVLEANPSISSYTCVDAVPESTFLCEFYTKYRGLQDRARVIPLDELETRLGEQTYQLALNIHSFSECTYAAIEWWLQRLQQMGVRNLLIVPNDPSEFMSTEVDRSHRDYTPLLDKAGYRLVAKEPVFDEPAVQALIGVRDHMYLFELR